MSLHVAALKGPQTRVELQRGAIPLMMGRRRGSLRVVVLCTARWGLMDFRFGATRYSLNGFFIGLCASPAMLIHPGVIKLVRGRSGSLIAAAPGKGPKIQTELQRGALMC